MATITWYMTNNLAGTAHQEMSTTDPGTEAFASPVVGTVVSTTSNTNTQTFDAQTETAATFADALQPDGTPNTGAGTGDCLRSTAPYTGAFASGNWVFHFCLRSNTAVAGSGRVRFRLLRGTSATGSGATDISGSQQVASTIALSTTVTNDSTLTVNPGAITVAGEYIFVQISWERTVAAGMSTSDVNYRIGNASSLGTRVVSADFTPDIPHRNIQDILINKPIMIPE